MKWKQIKRPGFTTLLSTSTAQPLARDKWPPWTQRQQEFTAGWFTPTGLAVAPSTIALSTTHAFGYVDFERRAADEPHFRYYRFAYARIADGRIFQTEPIKNLEYARHRDSRPPWLTEPST